MFRHLEFNEEPIVSKHEARPANFDPTSTRPSLLLRLKADDAGREIAWREFYARYGQLIFHYAQRAGATRTEAEEVVQDVITSFYRIQPKFVYTPQQGRFRHFLRTCARNAVISRLRKRKHEVNAADLAEDLNAEEPAKDLIWEELWEAEQLQQAITATQNRYATNEKRRQTFKAFELYVLLGHDAKQVAERLGISVDSVHAAKTRVTRALREELLSIKENEADE